MVNVNLIKRFDGDFGAHCNSCENLAVYSVSLRSASFRMCESCAEKLCADLDFALTKKVCKPKRQPTPRALDVCRYRWGEGMETGEHSYVNGVCGKCGKRQ